MIRFLPLLVFVLILGMFLVAFLRADNTISATNEKKWMRFLSLAIVVCVGVFIFDMNKMLVPDWVRILIALATGIAAVFLSRLLSVVIFHRGIK